MIKRSLIGVAAVTLLSTSVWAQDPIEEGLALIEAKKSIPNSLMTRADKLNNAIMEQTDKVLEMLLSIPFEQRQYVYPSIFEANNLPKKIRKHPEIAIWEGTVPTRIAPQAQEYAAKYLKDMKPALYIYLSPEAYSEVKDAPQSRTLNLPTVIGNFKVVSDGNYQSVKEFIHLPPDLIKDPNKSILSEAGLKKTEKGLEVFNAFLKDKSDNDNAFRSGFDFLSLFQTDFDEERVNPFQVKLLKIKKLGAEKELDTLLQKEGWKSAAEFAFAMDATAKAYRVNFIPIQMAFEFRRYRAIEDPKTDVDRLTHLAARMYEAYPADVNLVWKNKDIVREAFIKNGYQRLLNSITIDELQN